MLDKYTAPQKLHATSGGRFHVMAKPSGSTCNLDCKYCFYLSKETLPKGPGTGEMSDDTLELFIRQYIEGVTGPQVVFSWQGGEPTLRGVDFYRRVVALQKKYAKPNQRIENDLQTNGVLLNEEWAAFLKEHRFLVGLSIDGPRELHDHFRVNKGGAPTFDKVMAAANAAAQIRRALQHADLRAPAQRLAAARCVPLSAPRVGFHLHPVHSDRAGENLRDTAPQNWDAIHGCRSLGSPAGAPRSSQFRCHRLVRRSRRTTDIFCRRIFDEWRRKDLGKVLVNHFETLVAQHVGLPSQLCIYSEFCGKGVAVEHDGSVYSCDHYVYPEYRLGHAAGKAAG